MPVVSEINPMENKYRYITDSALKAELFKIAETSRNVAIHSTYGKNGEMSHLSTEDLTVGYKSEEALLETDVLAVKSLRVQSIVEIFSNSEVGTIIAPIQITAFKLDANNNQIHNEPADHWEAIVLHRISDDDVVAFCLKTTANGYCGGYLIKAVDEIVQGGLQAYMKGHPDMIKAIDESNKSAPALKANNVKLPTQQELASFVASEDVVMLSSQDSPERIVADIIAKLQKPTQSNLLSLSVNKAQAQAEIEKLMNDADLTMQHFVLDDVFAQNVSDNCYKQSVAEWTVKTPDQKVAHLVGLGIKNLSQGIDGALKMAKNEQRNYSSHEKTWLFAGNHNNDLDTPTQPESAVLLGS